MAGPQLRPRTWLLLFILGLSLLRLLLIGFFPLAPDEAYYFAWSRRPAVCYYDQPGLVAWVDYLFALPWSRPTVFTLRLAAVFLSALATWLFFRAYLEYRGEEKEAAVFAGLFSLLPFTWLTGVIIIHDTALLPCLGFAYWMIVRLARFDGRTRDWLLVGFALALAMYAKFSAVMVGWGLVLYMLWSPKARRWFLSWRPYAAGLLALLLYLPVVVWNYHHDWISVQAVRELTSVSYTSVSRRLSSCLEFILSQVGIFSPLIGLTVFAAFFQGLRQAIREPKNDAVTLPVCLALPALVYFLQQSLRTHVFGNWPGVVYLPLAMLAMNEINRTWSTRSGRGLFSRRYLWTALAVNFLLILLLWLHIQFRTFRPLLSWLEAKYGLEKRIDQRLDQDFGGWEEMVALVQAYRSGQDFILARNYQVASMLEFLLPDQPFVECYNQGQRGNQWDLWSALAKRQGQSALYIDFKKMPKPVKERFAEVELLTVAVVGEEPRPVKRWFVYRARGWKGP